MLKPDSLRAAICTVLPDLTRDPERLLMWIDKGGVRSTLTDRLAFTTNYTLNVIALGLGAGHELALHIAVLYWLRTNQPMLLSAKEDAFTFEVDVLDNGQVDIAIRLTLSETVSATQREDGGFDMQVKAEPNPLFPDLLGLGDVDPIPPLSEIWLNPGGKLLPEDTPVEPAP